MTYKHTLTLFLFLIVFNGWSQSSVNTSGSTQENNTLINQFTIGEISIQDEEVTNSGFQTIVLSSDITVSTSPIVIDDFKVSVYPNPTVNQVSISSIEDESLMYYLIDAHGVTINSQLTNGKETIIDMTSFKSGTYYLRLQNQLTNQSVTLSIIKQ